MNEYIISCCTPIDTSMEWVEEKKVYPCFFHLYLGTDEYIDDFEKSITTAEIYKRMLAGEKSKTSQVNVQEYEDHFRKFLDEGKDIIHVTLASGISGTYNSACIARDVLKEEYPDRKIIIIDSTNATGGYALLVDKMCELRDEGMNIDDLAAWAEAHKHFIQSWFFTSDLKFLIMGGRVSKASGFIGNVLNICPLLEIGYDGSLKTREKIRTKKKVMERILQKMTETADDRLEYSGKCFINQAGCPEDGEKMASMIADKFPNLKGGKPSLFKVGPTISCHTGPGTIAVFWWGDERIKD